MTTKLITTLAILAAVISLSTGIVISTSYGQQYQAGSNAPSPSPTAGSANMSTTNMSSTGNMTNATSSGNMTNTTS
jgi:hypothetical protein